MHEKWYFSSFYASFAAQRMTSLTFTNYRPQLTHRLTKDSDFALNARKISVWLGGTRCANDAQSTADFATLLLAMI